MFNNPNVMPTFTGVAVDLAADPYKTEIRLVDIAWALSQQCRFAGHTTAFYSVAEHCIRVYEVVPDEHKLVALFHDATEAYIQDIIRPLRVQLDPAGYLDLERRWARRIGNHFGVGDALADLPEPVFRADLVLLATECRDLITTPSGVYFGLGVVPLKDTIVPSPQMAIFERFVAIASDLAAT